MIWTYWGLNFAQCGASVGKRGSRENSHLGTRSMACMPLPIVAAPVLVAHSRSNAAPDELDNIQAFRTALRLFSDQELSSMLTQALRRQAIFREQEKVLMHRAEGDLVQWIGSALAQVSARIQAIKGEWALRHASGTDPSTRAE